MLGALTGVLLLIFAVAWLFKRMQAGHSGGRQHLKIVGVLPLSAKERVVLIQAGEEQVLVGVSGAGIHHLHKLNEPVPTALAETAIGVRSGDEAAATPSFAQALRSALVRNQA